MQFTLPDSMEPKSQSVCTGENVVESQEKKSESTETASDRESSIESFHTNKSELSIPTETELIDVDDIELSDEESWLYKSPKKLSADEKTISTYKWLHKDVEDMDDTELQDTKTALLSKLNELKILDSDVKPKVETGDCTDAGSHQTSDSDIENKDKILDSDVKKKEEVKEFSDAATNKTCDNLEAETSLDKSFVPVKDIHLLQEKIEDDEIINKEKLEELDNVKKMESNVLDVVDVQKLARLQEESLRQSTSRFLSQAERKPAMEKGLSPSIYVQGMGLSKPASIEALNTCNGKLSHSNVYALAPVQGMKKQNLFSSSAALNHNQELHRGSLPNINKGYYSLRSKKSKQSSDQKTPCPLPVYPSHSKIAVNGTHPQTSPSESQRSLISPPNDYRESRTLPSSYRVHSRSNSSSRRDLSALSPSPRRESTSFLSGQKSSPITDSNRRDSVPCNARKYLSPVSSPALYQRCNVSTPVLQSPTKVYNNQSQNLKSPPNVEYHRNSSHSPSRRLPLTTVHNHSPKRGCSPASPRNGEFRAMKLPSKIPSPASRSGIPVPSTPFISKTNAEDETWSQDCF